MKTLKISSVPMLELTQEAYEHMVTTLTNLLHHEHNIKTRSLIIDRRQKAMEMVNHIIELIKENKSDASNPKS